MTAENYFLSRTRFVGKKQKGARFVKNTGTSVARGRWDILTDRG
jgi:hypothetical protein